MQTSYCLSKAMNLKIKDLPQSLESFERQVLKSFRVLYCKMPQLKAWLLSADMDCLELEISKFFTFTSIIEFKQQTWTKLVLNLKHPRRASCNRTRNGLKCPRYQSQYFILTVPQGSGCAWDYWKLTKEMDWWPVLTLTVLSRNFSIEHFLLLSWPLNNRRIGISTCNFKPAYSDCHTIPVSISAWKIAEC